MARGSANTSEKLTFVQKLFVVRHSDIVKAPRNAHFVLLTAIVAVLNIIGVLMVLSASSVSALGKYGTAWFFFRRQLFWLLLGAAAYTVMSRIPYTLWQKYTRPIVIITVVMLVAVLIPGVGIHAHGSARWLGFGSWRFQPSELAKFALIVFCADFLNRRVSKMGSFKDIMGPILATTSLIMFFVVVEPDYDSTVVLALIVGMILLMSGIPFSFLTRIAAPVVAIATAVAFLEPYRRARIFSFLHPFDDAGNTGYQSVQSMIALGSGHATGVGLGAGKAKWLFLPNAHTDFIFSIIGEELGFIGTMMVSLLFVAFILLGIRIILSCKDRFSALMATGVVTWIGGQAIINLMAVLGLLPVSGITLPFVSFGGSSLLISMAATGVLANIARYSRA
jgi:cell division protein FtsW